MNKRQTWVAGGAVLAALILVAGWFLVVSPVRHDTSKTKAQTAQVQSDNDRLQEQLNQLIALKPGVVGKQAQLQNIAAEIPGDPQLPKLIRQLTTMASDSNVDVVSFTPSTPTAPTSTSANGSVSLGSAARTPGSHVAVADTYMTVPIALQVNGDYASLEEFLQHLETVKRIFVVNQITLAPANSPGITTFNQSPNGTVETQHTLNATLSASVFMTNPSNVSDDLPALDGTTAAPAAKP